MTDEAAHTYARRSAHEERRAAIARQTAAFLERGGKITEVPRGVSKYSPKFGDTYREEDGQ